MTRTDATAPGRLVFDLDTPVENEAQRACSVVSRGSGEPIAGWTAPAPQPWILVEDDGPWGDTAAARDPRVPAQFRRALEERGVRLQLVRRPDRRRQHVGGAGGAFVALAWSDRQRSWAETTHLDEPYAQLGDDVLDVLADGRRCGIGDAPVAPLVLACTHGRVDPCCARYGRPVAARLADAYGPMVWETTHVGGCRMAANVLVLPDGVMYGHTDPGLAVRQVGAHLAGRLLDEPGLRGQAGIPRVAQVAELAVRRATDTWELHAVTTTGVRDGGAVQHVTVDADGRTFTVAVAVRTQPERPLGCGDTDRWAPEGWIVTDLRQRS